MYGQGIVRIQKVPDVQATEDDDAYSSVAASTSAGTLVVVDITSDLPSAEVIWPLTIEVYYDQAVFDVSGIGDEPLLALYYWDPEQAMWRLCPESGVNTDRNCVVAAAYHPARFAIKMPHLLLWGLEDTALLPVSRDGLAEFANDLRIVEIEDAGHWIVHTHPEFIAEQIRKFIAV